MEIDNNKILVVDDNAMNRALLASRLKQLGYGVLMAEHGRQALEIIRNNPVDVILLDLMMPEMDGFQVLEIIKEDENLKYIPVIIISSLDEMESVVRCIKMGATDYLPKPFDPALLQARISTSLDNKKAHDNEKAYLKQIEKLSIHLKQVNASIQEEVEKRTEELRQAQAQLVAQKLLQNQVETAAEVQKNLQPRFIPDLDGYEFVVTAIPAHYVSGDLYDFVLGGADACHIILADISGKGIPAALLTSTARALIRSEIQRQCSPAVYLSNVNAILFNDLEHAELFITFLAGRLNPNRGSFTYANAGHTECLWWQGLERKCSRLGATGIPLGIFDEFSLEENTLYLRPGDFLIFYSDGITEAPNSREELFGIERLEALVAENFDLMAAEIMKKIIDGVEMFSEGTPRADDITLIVLKAIPHEHEWEYPGTMTYLDEMVSLIKNQGQLFGEEFASQFELAASEVITNIIEHAYAFKSGQIKICLEIQADRMQVDLYDRGSRYEAETASITEPGTLEEGGFGLFLSAQMLDELVYSDLPGKGNHWRLVKIAAPREIINKDMNHEPGDYRRA